MKNYSFLKFSKLLTEYVDKCVYNKIRSVALDLNNFIQNENAYTVDNQLKYYFEKKRSILMEIFDIQQHSANFFSACFLDYQSFQRLSLV